MDTARFEKLSDTEWRIPPSGAMRVPAVTGRARPRGRASQPAGLHQGIDGPSGALLTCH
jgi:hypothetical protein